MKAFLRKLRSEIQLPAAARTERRRDRSGLPSEDPGIDAVVREGIEWLLRAQRNSASADGGVARHYSLISGWGPSYPETTGYIIPTLLDYGRENKRDDVISAAIDMLDWLVAIQLENGAFQAGRIDHRPLVPVTFNTGQILLGLATGTRDFGERYETAAARAADWLRDTQDPDGCWRRYPTPFAASGDKTYETHVAWGLLEAERQLPGRGYGEAALRQVRWAITQQRGNGWLANCCLNSPAIPLTHTLGYALRGLVEAYRFSEEQAYLDAAVKTGDALVSVLADDGFLAGRFDSDWQPARPWACLTGTVQIAHCWLELFNWTEDPRYLDAACLANRYVRRTVSVSGDPAIRGAVKGSFPVDGGYGRYEYLNWAVKFCVDANRLESRTLESNPPGSQLNETLIRQTVNS